MHTHFRVQRTVDGGWEWVLIVRGKTVARSSREFRRSSDAVRDVEMVKRYSRSAEIDKEL